jgi:D-beta-D-heptose 7-phosphate kinase/D-beta-D-heptose 1-phosphate adenosyltransferase
MSNQRIVAVSGGFDPLHVGHIRYFLAAKQIAPILVVILNGDSFLMRKKGYAFMPLEERIEIIQNIKCVDVVWPFESESDNVADAIRAIKPDYFAKAGDRNLGNIPLDEILACREVGCEIRDGLDSSYTKHSSLLVKEAAERAAWGVYK